jgi:hypothetical protein
MSGTPQYRNTIDKQLSELVEGDLTFKNELVSVYSRYMRDIPEEFAQLVNQKNAQGLALLDHKYKTTCQVLALQQLSGVFKQTRSILESKPYADKVLDDYIIRVTTICNTALAQLQELH